MTEIALAQLGHELAVAHADAGELTCDLGGETWRRLRTGGVQLCGETTHVLFGGSERLRRRRDGIDALVDRVQLSLRLQRPREQLLVRLGPEAPPCLGDAIELGLDLLEPAGLRLEARQEAAQLARRLAQS